MGFVLGKLTFSDEAEKALAELEWAVDHADKQENGVEHASRFERDIIKCLRLLHYALEEEKRHGHTQDNSWI